jgi:membrane fusion protein (multidrug efflux system)
MRDLFPWSLAFCAALCVCTGCGQSDAGKPKSAGPPAVPVTIAEVTMVTVDRTLPVVGTLLPKDEAAISAQVEGQVEKTLVDFGARVEAGQLLALIDTASYEAQAAQAAATLAKAQANQKNAERNLKRVLELQQEKISSASALDEATALAEQARAEIKAAEATGTIAELNLRRSRVVAPFSGSISERIVNTGDFMKVGSPLFRVVNDMELKYIIQAPERLAGQVKIGQLVRFDVDAFPGESFEGKVHLISPLVSTSTRSFNLGALVANPTRKLKASSFARGEILLEKDVSVATVPLEAVLNFAGVTKVFVIQGDVARSQEVKIGRILAGRQEIISGLRTGEKVAISGLTRLFENAKVRQLSVMPSAAENGTNRPALHEAS